MSGLSIFSQVIGYAAGLMAAGSPPGPTTRYRTLPYKKIDLPAFAIYPHDDAQKERVGTGSAPLSDRDFVFRVVCYGKGDPIDAALDPLLVWAAETIMADQTFGGLTDEIQHIGTHWRADDQDEVYGAVALDFSARIQIIAADLTMTGDAH